MRHKTAVRVCSNWYGGQWSALYQFLSSGIYMPENHLRYLQEIETDLHPEYNLCPGELSKRDERELNGLKQFFIKLGEKHGLKTEYHEHELYGYLIPYLTEDTPSELAEKVNVIYYMK